MKPITALLTLTLAAGALTACDAEITTTPGGQAKAVSASSSPVPPKEALTTAVKALDTTAYNFAIKQGVMSGGGRVDPGARTAVLDIGGDVAVGGDVGSIHVSVAYTIITPDMWIKADFGDAINKQFSMDPVHWMHVDRKKITGTQIPLDSAGNPEVGITELLGALGEVKRTDKTHFTGTVDVTGVEGIMAPSDTVLKKAGDKARTVPFTATVDEHGRLTNFKIDGAAFDPDLAMELTFTGFGSVQPVTAPTNAIEAPDPVYELIG
ncbi:hypothetical protein [Dactylosporangium sp. CA-233914]|uniref:hypothetical protein n=1 Tax=Dactylosporangium sp. CA-233914 TaxID=3239934 RepID=UPI003D93D6F0